MIVPVSDKTLQIKRFYRKGQRIGIVLYDASAPPFHMIHRVGWLPKPLWWDYGLDAKTYAVSPGKELYQA